MLDYEPDEWAMFTSVEKRIILLVREKKIDDKQKVMSILTYPLPPMNEITFRGHWARVCKKVQRIRNKRLEVDTIKK